MLNLRLRSLYGCDSFKGAINANPSVLGSSCTLNRIVVARLKFNLCYSMCVATLVSNYEVVTITVAVMPAAGLRYKLPDLLKRVVLNTGL